MFKTQKTRILTLFVLLVTLTSSSNVFAATTLDVSRVKQAKDKWCWAATSEMIGVYQNSSTSRTQWDAVKYLKGSSYPNKGGTDTDITKAIKYISMDSVTYKSGTVLSWSKHTSNIADSNPIAVKIVWDGGGAHAVVCAGTKTSSGNNYLYIIDPWENNASTWYKYDAMKTGTKLPTSKGKYTTSFWLS